MKKLYFALVALLLASPVSAQQVRVVPDSVVVQLGDTVRPAVTVTVGGGRVVQSPALTFSSSNSTVFSATRSGQIIARALGCANWRVTNNTYARAQVPVCVVPKPAPVPPPDTTPTPVPPDTTPTPPPVDTVVPTPTPTPTTPLVFESSWNTATGNTGPAVTDGGRWDVTACGSLPQVLTVVPGAPLNFTETANVLRMQMRQWECGTMQKQNAVPQSTTHWGRFYVRNDEFGTRNDHTMAYNNIHGGMGMQAVPFSRWAQNVNLVNGTSLVQGQWLASVIFRFPYPYGRWYSPVLQAGVWYRYEYQMEYVTATTYRIWPRIYDMNGTLLYDADDFRIEGGRTNLAQYYDIGGANRAAPLGVLNTETSRPEYARHFGIGNEGPNNSTMTLGYWYYAKIGLSTTGWIGR